MSRMVACAIAVQLVDAGLVQMGFFVIFLFETYGRPSESLAVRGMQVIRPTRGLEGSMACWSIVFNAREWDRPGKTDAFDHTVVLDLTRQSWMGRCLEKLAVNRRTSTVWDFTYVEFFREFRRAVLSLGLQRMNLCPYMLRHGGASHDRGTLVREIQDRGGWRSFASVQRYEKHGRLGLMLQQLTAKEKQECMKQEALVPKVFGARLR